VKSPEEVFMSERVIEFEGIMNFRDIGGYRARDGKSIRWGAVYRSGDFSAPTNADLRRFSALHIRTVLDLRSDQAVEKKPDRFPESSNPRIVHLPIFTPEIERWIEAWRTVRDSGAAGEIDSTKLFVDIYKSIVRVCGTQIAAVFEELCDRQNLPAVLHCSQGKDRTGVVTSLVQTALGVSYAEVAQDYILSNPLMHNFVEKLVVNDPNPDMSRSLIEARIEFLDAAYQYIRLNHGSPEAYISHVLGFTHERIEALQQALLE
jgi:protein-tyrosine phosphatase